ncbi:MAG: glycoside hydrolase family 3 N-terminal domain-containing protein [Ruthenibacterium lactatiformans]
MLCSAKHFPGHGDTDTDSHLALPCVDKSMEELERTELLPFREAVRTGVPAVMTTHILFPQLEPEHLPATMSRRIMTGLLRDQMGFDGLIVSDCMEVRAIKDHFGTVNGVVAAMAAGVDLCLFPRHTAQRAGGPRGRAVAEGRLSAAEMQASVQRILALKEKWVDGMPEGGFDFDAARRENEALLQKTITEVHRPAGGRPALGSAPLCIGCPAYPTSWWGMWMPARRTASATVWHGRCMAARRPCSRSRGGKRSRVGTTGTAAYLGRGGHLQRALAQGPAGAGGPAGGGGRAHRGGGAARPVRSGGPARKRVDAGGAFRVYGAEHWAKLRVCCAARPNQPGGCP